MVQPSFVFNTMGLKGHWHKQKVLQKPDYHNDDYYYIGAVIALSCAVCRGFLNISINHCHNIKSVILLFWSGIGATFFSLVCFSFDENAKMLSYQLSDIENVDWIAYFGIGLFGILGKI